MSKKLLEGLLKRKKGVEFYADELGVSIEQIKIWKKEIKSGKKEVNQELTIEGSSHKKDIEKGTYELTAKYSFPPSEETIIKDHKIDTDKYRLKSFYTKGQPSGHWLVTALFSEKTTEEKFVGDFTEFLKTYKPSIKPTVRSPKRSELGPGSLILNKQDAHHNKRCESGTGNDIFDRFEEYEANIQETLKRASRLSNLEHVTYIIGSDQFNSEVTGATVKGTIQSNILNYYLSFELVCQHEVKVVTDLLKSSNSVDIIYLVANHDACVSYHLVSWLKAYFKDEPRLNIDISQEFTKYFSLYDTAVAINHGDVQKPEKLAQNFPLQYKEGFAKANHHIVLIGDRHTELTKDIGGIKFYQIPALSKAKGNWEKQMGYTTTPAQMTSFLIEPNNGVSTILKITL